MRFALVHIVDFRSTRWEIHEPECYDVTRSLHCGSFVAIASADSPEALMKSELAERGAKTDCFTIMPCCADRCANETTRLKVHRILMVYAATG
jgi:hypothetical protein